jgi:O-antigen/teichoic acid export membrane protein
MFANFYISFFNASEKMHFTALLTSSQSVLISVICLSLILIGLKDVEYILCGYILANFFMLIVSFYLVSKSHSFKFSKIDLRFSLNFVQHSIPFGIFIIGGMLYFQSDTIMLSVMKSNVAVGIYQAPMRLILVLDILPLLLSTAMYPTVSKIFADSKNEAINFVSKSLKYLFLLAIPISFAICLFSEHIIFIIFGSDFFSSIQVLKILIWIFPIRICCHLLGTTLSAADKQSHRALATGLSAVLNVLLNLLLIPPYNYNGAAFASVITSGFLAMFYHFSIQKEFQVIQLKKVFVFPIVSIIMMFIMAF